MAWTAIDHTAVDRKEVSRAAFGYPVVDDLNDLNSRTSTVESRTTNATSGNTALDSRVSAVETGKTTTARKIIAGTGLTGGGDLTADRTLAVAYGTAAGTSAQGNDSRFTDASTKLGLLQSYGRWYFPTNSLRSAGQTAALVGWTPIQALAGVTVDGTTGDWTFANAGVYELTFGWHASYSLPVTTGFNTNCFISDSALTVVYGQTQGYAVQYASGTLETSATIYSGPISLAAGAKVRLWTGFAQDVTITGADGYRRTFFAVRRLS